MEDTLLKAVRITDNIKLEIYQQGKRRKYALFRDSENTKTPKLDVSLTDDQAIEQSLYYYNVYLKKATNSKRYVVIQDPYKDPLPVRTYGSGTASPYYLNNGCAINILWTGSIPNPAFDLGTYSNPWEAEDEPGLPDRFLHDQIITSSNEDAEEVQYLPKSTWQTTGTFSHGFSANGQPKVYDIGYRDVTNVTDKIVTVMLPNGVKEEGEYLVWTEGGLQYNTKSIPENAPFENRFVLIRTTGRPDNQIKHFTSWTKDSDIVRVVIGDFISKATFLHGKAYTELKLCSPDTGSCSVIPYVSPLQPETYVRDETPKLPDAPAATMSVAKVKFTIDGIADPIEVKVNSNLDPFIVWAGPIPKPVEQYEALEDMDELDPEYYEDTYRGAEEIAAKITAGEGIRSEQDVESEMAATYNTDGTPIVANDAATDNCPGGSTGLVSTGTYTSELPKESAKNGANPAPGYNGVPFYMQGDPRWATVIYGKAKDGTFIEAKVEPKAVGKWVNVSWNGGNYQILVDHSHGDAGWSSIQGGGCGITSLAMVINYWANKGHCKPTSPVKTAKLCVESGCRPGPIVCSGTGYGAETGTLAKKLKEHFNLVYKILNAKQAEAAVKKGIPIVFLGGTGNWTNFRNGAKTPKQECNSAGHFVVITGYDGSRYRVNDPGGSPTGYGSTHLVAGSSFPSAKGYYAFVAPGSL